MSSPISWFMHILYHSGSSVRESFTLFNACNRLCTIDQALSFCEIKPILVRIQYIAITVVLPCPRIQAFVCHEPEKPENHTNVNKINQMHLL